MKMRLVLLFLVAIVPNVSSTTTTKATTAKVATAKATTPKATTPKATTPQSYVYVRGDDLKGCTTGERVLSQEECRIASYYFRDETGRPAALKEDKNLNISPGGCYYYVQGKELHFNNENHNDLKKLFAGDEPICKVPGTGWVC